MQKFMAIVLALSASGCSSPPGQDAQAYHDGAVRCLAFYTRWMQQVDPQGTSVSVARPTVNGAEFHRVESMLMGMAAGSGAVLGHSFGEVQSKANDLARSPEVASITAVDDEKVERACENYDPKSLLRKAR